MAEASSERGESLIAFKALIKIPERDYLKEVDVDGRSVSQYIRNTFIKSICLRKGVVRTAIKTPGSIEDANIVPT
jgi:hypothetical protein